MIENVRSNRLSLRLSDTGNQDINEPAGALLPPRDSSGVKDTDERANDVVGVGVREEIAACNSAVDSG